MSARVDPAWWSCGTVDGRPIRETFERRDVAGIFRFLHSRGLSYTAIGGLVGMSANRVAEVARGSRLVTAYDVLERIAVGLAIPRGAMGLGRDEPPTEGDVRFIDPPGGVRGTVVQAAPPDGGDGAGLDWLARVRVGLDEALACSSVSSRQVELIEESTAEHVRVYPVTAPTVMLQRLATECAEVQGLSLRRQPAAVQARLSGAAAVLATMSADALMRLGAVSQARLWYRTAVLAADDSGEGRLGVLVRAQAAMLPYYFGNPDQIVSLTRAALDLGAAPTGSHALAAAGQARALARIGSIEPARAAIDEARRLFDLAGDPDSDEAFRFPAKRLLFYLSGALTWLRETGKAYRVQDEALTLYGDGGGSIDPTLIALDRAMCLVWDRRPAEAAAVAVEALEKLSEDQRTEIVLSRADEVVASLPIHERPVAVLDLVNLVAACRGRAHRLVGANLRLGE